MVIQQNNRQLLMMDILMLETCWAYKKWNKIASDIKLVFYSSVITMMHGPINIRFIFKQNGMSSTKITLSSAFSGRISQVLLTLTAHARWWWWWWWCFNVILPFCWPCISVINQIDAQNFCFTISLFHASTCFEHMCSWSGGQNCITQPLVSSHL